MSRLLQILWNNVGTFLLALLLALAVWVSAVVAADPNEERTYPLPVELTVIPQKSDLLLIGSLPNSVSLRLEAPQSVLDQLESEPEQIIAYVDLAELPAGNHSVPVHITVGLNPHNVLEVSPDEVNVTLEPLLTREMPIETVVTGELALGYQSEQLTLGDSTVNVSGPQSAVELVDEVRAELDISGLRDSVSREVTLRPVDENGQLVTGVELDPGTVIMNQVIDQLGGFRDVAVKVETVGQPLTGYRVTNISVSPPTVTIFSSDPELVAGLPGFVSTDPVDLSQASDDIEVRLALDLPDDVQTVGEQSVTVLVGIAAIESSIPVSIPVEYTGLSSEFGAVVSPATVDVILAGPLTELDDLEEGDVRIFVDLTDLEMGTHLVEPQAEILPARIRVESITPETIEVVIGPPLTPTRTPTITQTPTATFLPLFTPTPTPPE